MPPIDKIHGLQQRAVLIKAVREFFQDRFFLEVDTPIRLPAIIPEANIVPVASSDWYLQTSPEICMKRLLAAGIPKLFQICKCFRHAERGMRHLPEFTMLEWYRAHADYRNLMDDCEELFLHVASQGQHEKSIEINDQIISLERPWERMTVKEAFRRFSSISLDEAMEKDCFDEELVQYVEPCLGIDKPVFLYDYPLSMASLARPKKTNPDVAERFELFVNGIELANGFSELTEATVLRARFMSERRAINTQGRDSGPLPESFLEELTNMPPSAGIALGLDRLVMLFINAQSVDQVVSFLPEELL